MSRNRVTGIDQNTSTLPSTTASSYAEGGQDDVLTVPPNAAAGTPYCTITLTGCGGSPTAGQQPMDGDALNISDPHGVLAVGTTLVVQGRSGGVGFQIADGAAAADSITLNTAGATRKYIFNKNGGAAGVGIWARA
jgi:hypothetical protein